MENGTCRNEIPLLIRRFLAGEREVFHDLIRPFEPAYYRIAFGILRHPQDAEDAVQQAIVQLFSHLGQLSDPERFRQWSLRIVQNEAKQLWRKRRANQYASLDDTGEEDGERSFRGPRDFADWRELPSVAVELQEVRQALAAAIEALPVTYREILLLRDVEQLNLAETMEVLGISEALVKTRLHRARLMLREALTPRFAKPHPSFWERWKGMNPWLHARR